MSDFKGGFKGGVPESIRQEIFRLHKEGVRGADIADRVGVSRSTVYAYLKYGAPVPKRSPIQNNTVYSPDELHKLPKRDKPHYDVLIFMQGHGQ